MGSGKKNGAYLILGFIIGAVSVFLFSGQQMENLYREREELKVSLFETRERLTKLEDLWESRGEDIIREVQIKLEMEEDTFGQLSLKQGVQEIVGDLVGEKVGTLNPSLVVRMLDGRKITADGREFLLELEAVVISETLTLYIRPRKISELPRDEP